MHVATLTYSEMYEGRFVRIEAMYLCVLQELPPIRNSLEKKKKKKKTVKSQNTKKASRISGYDFQAWDKFDVVRHSQEYKKMSITVL